MNSPYLSGRKEMLLALHEAGHVVVALHFGFGIRYATIRSKKKGKGNVCFYGRKVTDEKHIMLLMGGGIAASCGLTSDERKTDELLVHVRKTGVAADHSHIYEILTDYYEPKEIEAALGQLYSKTFEILEEQVEALMAIAKGLLAHKTLTGKRLREIFYGDGE